MSFCQIPSENSKKISSNGELDVSDGGAVAPLASSPLAPPWFKPRPSLTF